MAQDYIWRWTTRIMPLEGSKVPPLPFEQSQLAGAVLSPKQLHRLAADYIPQLSEQGLLRRRTFELMDGRASLEEIADKLVAEFPKRFSGCQEALSHPVWFRRNIADRLLVSPKAIVIWNYASDQVHGLRHA